MQFVVDKWVLKICCWYIYQIQSKTLHGNKHDKKKLLFSGNIKNHISLGLIPVPGEYIIDNRYLTTYISDLKFI